jgi:hypothetical protein
MITGVFRSVFDRHILIGRASSGFRRLLKLRNAALLSMVAVLVCGPFSRGVWAATYTATSCSYAAFNTALSSAHDGDTVIGPSGGGSATWSNVLTVGVGITLNFNGCTITFTRNSGGITVNTDSTSFVMTNGTFSQCQTNGSYPVGINMASGPPYNAPWRIYNITFTDDSSGGTCYGFVGLGPGLYDHNTITTNTDAAETIHILGGNEGCTSCWTEDVVPGSANMPIFENDVWTESSSSNYCQGEEGNYGAVFTIRDSQLNNCQIDVHGGPPSNRWIEFYNNTFNNGCCASGAFIDWRGGSGLFYGNTVNGTPKGGTSTNLGPIGGSSDNTGSYPVAYQFGMGIDGTHYSPTYLWGSGAPEQLTNIYNRTTAQVQIGSTYNDCSGLSGSLCNAVVTASQPATLERCESAADVAAGCPVSYTYTPYQYPHPLDTCPTSQVGAGGTCGSSSTQAPAPPTLTWTLQP